MGVLKTSKSVHQRSAKAKVVFQKTVADLALIDRDIDIEDQAKAKEIALIKEQSEARIAALSAEREALATTKIENETFTRKINEFFGIE